MVQAGQVMANRCVKATDFSEGETLGPGQNLGAVVSECSPPPLPLRLLPFCGCLLFALDSQGRQVSRLDCHLVVRIPSDMLKLNWSSEHYWF